MARSIRPRSSALRLAAAILAAPASLAAAAPPAHAQQPATADTLATVRVRVTRDSAGGAPATGAIVRSGAVGAQTDAAGEATLRLPPGARVVAATLAGLRADSARVALRAGGDTTIALVLAPAVATLGDVVVVGATRGERRVEDTPLRVEVIDEEEIAEKVAMTPGDIAMMLNETSGLRVQTTNPALGGANVRIQGLRGRYSLLLADGLPLHGAAGGLGLLQIPPVDLGRVEIIKGAASALYGSTALGGVINLVSRRPGEAHERTMLANRTSRGGTDAVYFGGGPVAGRWGYTVLAGGHLQRRGDVDRDGWTDLAGYERAVVRPRLYFDDGAGSTAFLTGGVTVEERDGGTIGAGAVAIGQPYAEALRTRRGDIGGVGRWIVDEGALRGAIVTARGSAVEQHHDHRFGAAREDDRHRTWFGEAALALPRLHGDAAATYVVGVALQRDAYVNRQAPFFDYTHTVPAAFAQVDVDPAPWLSASASARLDAHDTHGTFVNPRLSLLLRRPADGALAGWTTRLSAGTGAFAPTPFTEETEATGLSFVDLPGGSLAALEAERARSASLDVGGPLETALGRLELNATAFGSRVARPLQVRASTTARRDGVALLELANAPAPTRTWGGELLARLTYALGGEAHDDDAEHDDAPHDDAAHDDDDARDADAAGADAHDDEPSMLRITGTYTYLRSTECDPAPGAACARREAPLTPRHAAGMVASVERHGSLRVGVELYYTGRQSLDANPYRATSPSYVHLGLLGERAVATRLGVARLFVNLENLTNVRQTRWDPLLLPARGPGGRWTTDAWTDLVGFTANGGVRLAF